MRVSKRSILQFAVLALAALAAPGVSSAAEPVFRIGIIGLDTSHSGLFTEMINDTTNNYGCRVVCAYPGGSPDIPTSIQRLPEYTARMRDELKVEIVSSIEDLCGKVDGVLLESVDGRKHLDQIRIVLRAKKPVFFDKPAAGSLGDLMEIYRLAREAGVPCFSSSSLRFCPGIAAARTTPEFGGVIGCEAFSPCPLEEHHPDLFWYGIHGVETLFTIMGPGCESVRRVKTRGAEHVVGVWKDGRIGTFRGIRDGRQDYGAFVYGAKKNGFGGGFTGFEGLAEEIVKFFKTGTPPVTPEETIEIYAFMTAADESKNRNGAAVTLSEVIAKAGKKR